MIALAMADPQDWLVETILSLIKRVPEHADALHHEMRQQGIGHPTIEKLVQALSSRSKECLVQMEG